MALVFIDARNLEAAIAIREAVLADDHRILMVESAADIAPQLEGQEEIALFLTDDLKGSTSQKMIRLFSSRIPRPPVIGALPDALPAQLGAAERELDLDRCLSLPPDPDEVRVVLGQQLERHRLQVSTGILGRTEAIQEVLDRVHLMAPVNSTVLLLGESGTGKELVARALHQLSARRGKSFIAVNCGALPESLLESELFGHEKGAFTGATSLRRGMFELADGGTLLLDEIGEMPATTQTRLLRVLESHRFMRVGGDREIEVNVRVIAATNRDLHHAVEQRNFRRDLYYRLNVLRIELPPLRERREDIPLLVRRFVEEFTHAHDREFKGLDPEAMDILLEYDWPGNIRELRNLVESMVVLAPGSLIRAADIPAQIRSRRSRARTLVPVRSAGAESVSVPAAGQGGLPEMEFVFRTLVEMRIDIEDLRHEFERFKARNPDLVVHRALGRAAGAEIELAPLEDAEMEIRDGQVVADAAPPAIAFSPGMTMADLEREAIILALKEVGGNRRKAAERLQIGERTLYRKLQQYEIDL
ncbi:MAG: sigma-54 interaction domain-containing protein [Gemmatimonadota bacterium]